MSPMGTNIITHEYSWAHWIHKSLSGGEGGDLRYFSTAVVAETSWTNEAQTGSDWSGLIILY